MSAGRGKSAAIFLLGAVLGAAAGSWGQRAAFRRMTRRGPDPKRMVEHLARGLGLDETQKASVLAVLESKRGDLEAVKKETFARLAAIREAADAEILKSLTPDQAAKFQEMRRARKLRVNWEAPPGFPPPPPAP